MVEYSTIRLGVNDALRNSACSLFIISLHPIVSSALRTSEADMFLCCLDWAMSYALNGIIYF
jgi:hypothetical protein